MNHATMMMYPNECLAARLLHAEIGPKLPEGVTLGEYKGGYTFRVLFKDGHAFDGVSISCPPGATFDGEQDLETALLKNNSLFYDARFGYEDVCRWANIGELLEEIKRLVPLSRPK